MQIVPWLICTACIIMASTMKLIISQAATALATSCMVATAVADTNSSATNVANLVASITSNFNGSLPNATTNSTGCNSGNIVYRKE